ncbi:hypothetical protein [Anabaena sp. PCC 7108]|uniref:hypothetical protein n=1 Tax=Anabaena sp. PCC 7108 TaxID=163908 RepID=UPI0003499D1D|nr:hypothetical protein [Anabaena sp. PCC 7108]
MTCQAGETARVTFPDDSTASFDGPIDIKCEDGLLLPERINVDIYVTYKFRTYYGTQTPKLFYDTERNTQTSTTAGYTAYTPVLGTRFRSQGDSIIFEILYFATSQATEPSWFRYGSVNSTYQEFLSCNITAIKPRSAPNSDDLKKKIITVSRNGIELFKNQYESCNFNVECLAPCPPNTMECGDCCLPCDTIFNQLSSVLAVLKNIK